MIVKLPFGSDAVALDLRGLRVRQLAPSAPPGVKDISAMVGRAVDDPVAGPSLAELAAGRRSAVVVVPDATRKVALPEVLPPLLDRLAASGVGGRDLTILVACGTHPEVDAEILGRLVGPVPADVRVVQHRSTVDDDLVTVGRTSSGTAIRIHRAAAEADLLITVGGVRHHYFAGFGGGPKMVFPGIAGHDEIQRNHSRVLDAGEDGRLRRHPACEPGRLDGNPVAEEIAAAADLRPPDLALCVVPGVEGRPAWAAAGPWRDAFSRAVERAREWYEVPAERFDLVVSSGGGAPSDSTLIQAHKALDAACRFACPGGEVLIVARLDQGAGSPAMEPFLKDPTPEAILSRLNRRWVQYGHTTLRIVERTRALRVWLHSELDDRLAARLGFRAVTAPESVIEGWRERRSGATVGLVTGPAVYPRV